MRHAFSPRVFQVMSTGWLVAAATLFATPDCLAEIAWQTNLQQAHAEAQKSGKPLLLHFVSENCVWCDRLEAGAFQAEQVGRAIEQGFVPVKVHYEQAKELAKMFRVTSFPTDVIVTPSGQTLSHGVSPQDPAKYVSMLAKSYQSMPQSPVSQPADTNPADTRVAANAGTQNPVPATQPSASGSRSESQFQLPQGPTAGKTSAQLAGAKTDAMTLDMPMPHRAADPGTEPVAESSPQEATADSVKLAMEGFCAVTVIDEQRWAEGNPKFGVIHLGKLYLFESQDKMATFLEDPQPYTPVLNEIDVIRFFEERRIVPGKREWGVQDPIHGRMFFFADEAAMLHFNREYQRYVEASLDVMDRAIEQSNPDAS